MQIHRDRHYPAYVDNRNTAIGAGPAPAKLSRREYYQLDQLGFRARPDVAFMDDTYTTRKEHFMRNILLVTVWLTASAVSAFAQVDADYQKSMKTVGARSGSLRKNLEAKNGEAASADAKKLQELFEQVHDFWRKKNVDDAAKFAMEARDGFGAVAEQASAGKFDDASATLKKTTAACGGCHNAHREKAADGSWTIK
jgi:cytochrome c556